MLLKIKGRLESFTSKAAIQLKRKAVIG